MVLVIIIAAIILLLVVSVYKEYKDRITAEELTKVIEEMIEHNEKISVLEKGIIYNQEEKEYITKGLEIAWEYEKDKTYNRLVKKYKELEMEIERQRFTRIHVELANDRRGKAKKEKFKREFEKSIEEKLNVLKVDYPEIYNKCFKDEIEVNEYIKKLVRSV